MIHLLSRNGLGPCENDFHITLQIILIFWFREILRYTRGICGILQDTRFINLILDKVSYNPYVCAGVKR